jgi:acyl-CoA synthetase (NDP forming)
MEEMQKLTKGFRGALSEHESKRILAAYEIPVTKEKKVQTVQDLLQATREIGFPVVLKGCSSALSHKTEKGLVKLDIRNAEEARAAFDEIMGAVEGSDQAVLVQEMVKGSRELVIGLTRDPQFGPCVMFGLGGIFTEILKDVTFRVAPLTRWDALEMMREIKAHRILDDIRGMEAVDRKLLADMLINVGRIGIENENVREIDINPVVISGNHPIAVDALVVLA